MEEGPCVSGKSHMQDTNCVELESITTGFQGSYAGQRNTRDPERPEHAGGVDWLVNSVLVPGEAKRLAGKLDCTCISSIYF